MQHRAFEVNGKVQDEQDSIRYAHAIADESGHSVMIWEEDTGLPFAWIAPEIRLRDEGRNP